MPFKTRFVSSRYLDPFRRYVVRKLARSRRVSVNGSRNSRKWRGPLFPPIYAHNVMVVVKVEKSADSASVSDQRTGAKRGIGRSTSGSERPWTRDEDGDRETAKITFGFKRRYLGNGKSYRLGTKSVRNGRLPRFLRPRNMRQWVLFPPSTRL